MDFLSLAKEKMRLVELDPAFGGRSLNEGFSGGEKKRNEVFQMAVLEPRLAILDEVDSGLDIDALRVVARGVNALRRHDRSILVVTHYKRLLEHVRPDIVHVMAAGRIVRSGGPELADELERTGYAWVAGTTPEKAAAGI
jgi:Fe-S cluster assembly ATP-binding protein